MNIEAYNTETLRKIVRQLESENRALKEKLREANIPFVEENPFEETIADNEEYDLDQGARIQHPNVITYDMMKAFFVMFWSRSDVFARRSGKGGYYPQCNNSFKKEICPRMRGRKMNCEDCPHQEWTKLEMWRIKAHLVGQKEDGSDVLGFYPLMPDGTCRYLVFDFDNHEKGAAGSDYANKDEEWHNEVDALRKMCERNGIKPLVERSRSGRGAHVWIFFETLIPAVTARNFGFLLLDKGAESINMKTFHYYDRMYPSQDVASKLGNLIALPLQGRALQNGNSAFVDENWNAYPNQWDILLNGTKKLTLEDVERFIAKWKQELADARGMLPDSAVNRQKPWRQTCRFQKEDVTGKLHMVLNDGVYIDTLNLSPRIQNAIRRLAAFDNPVFYKKKRMGYSNYYEFTAIYLGKDVDGYIRLPRGLRERVLEECKKAEIAVDISDEREIGRPIRVSFRGDLQIQQDLAAQSLLSNTDGVLSAATAFGKTVVCSYLIAARRVNTLILLQSKELLEQWVEELNKFLEIQEEPPMYETKTGKKKKRDSVIGVLHGGKNTMTGIIDIAMVGSINGKGNFEKQLRSYGLVIMDECHHAASETCTQVLEKVNAKYVYGVSATPKRSDQMEKKIFMLLGPIRHKYTARERANAQGIGHYFIPRYTRVVETAQSRESISKAYELVAESEARDKFIAQDVKYCLERGQSPLILTRLKSHAKALYQRLKDSADHVFLLYGDNSDAENMNMIKRLKNVPRGESMVLVATGQKIGEGFDCPRLDVLMLAAPVSDGSRLEQYVGRINRDYEGKKAVYVYDYVDSHIRFFDKMYAKRLKTYKRIGFSLWNEGTASKQIVDAIYDSGNYMEIFERDIAEAEKNVVISSSDIRQDKVERLILIAQPIQERGVEVTVITTDPEDEKFESADVNYQLIQMMEQAGICVVKKSDVAEQFAVIDDRLVWHGGMHLLGKEDTWDNLIRIKDVDVAAELLVKVLGKDEET